MKHYSKERKAAIVVKMMAPHNMSIVTLAEQSGISEQTLYNWRKKAKEKGGVMKSNTKNATNWSSANKFEVVLETASLNATELSEYCRSKGLYAEQIKEWKQICVNANATRMELSKLDKERTKEDKKIIKTLERELTRKEKALAEAAALLILKKKAQNLWRDLEEG